MSKREGTATYTCNWCGKEEPLVRNKNEVTFLPYGWLWVEWKSTWESGGGQERTVKCCSTSCLEKNIAFLEGHRLPIPRRDNERQIPRGKVSRDREHRDNGWACIVCGQVGHYTCSDDCGPESKIYFDTELEWHRFGGPAVNWEGHPSQYWVHGHQMTEEEYVARGYDLQ